MDIEIENYSPNQYFTKYSKINSIQTVTVLNDQFTLYFIMKLDIFNKPKESFTFSFNDKYSMNVFYGIILDTKALGVFTAKKP